MKNFYGKYIANACGIAASVFDAMYLLLIFFAGVNTLLIPSFFLSGNIVNYSLITLVSKVLHILSVAFLVLFYVKYFSKDNEDKTLKTLAVVFSLITVGLTVFSYNIEALFLLTTINGILAAALMFVVCISQFYYIADRNNPLLKVSRVMMTMSVISVLLFVLSATTYYEITAAVLFEALGKMLSVRKNYALSFILYALSCFLQAVEFGVLYVAEKMENSK